MKPWSLVLLPLVLAASGSALAQSQLASRVALSTDSSQPKETAFAINATFTESFDGAFPPAGWVTRNQSTAIGSNTNCWNGFTGTTPWNPQAGAGHAGANFNCTTGANTISGWLLTPPITAIANGDVLRFWTRKASPDTFPDRLEVRLCLDTTPDSCGAAGSTGAAATDVGSFTTLVTSVNPTLVTGVYPTTYTEFTVNLAGLPAGPNNGRLAFRYFVTSGGPNGANSDILSIDTVSITPPPSTVNYTNTAGPLNFTGNVGVATAAQNVNVAAGAGNTEALNIQSCAFSGANAADFSFSAAPSFPLSVAAGANVDLPVQMTASAAGGRTATLTCQTPNATAPSGTSFAVTLNGTATADTPPTLNYTPSPATPINFPTGPAGVANSSIAISASGATGAGFTSVTNCTFAPAGPFTAATTPANGQFSSSVTSGSIDLTCTRGAVAANSTLTCDEATGISMRGAVTPRSWPVTCPAADAPVLAATKTVSGTFTPGGSITYVITISNTGTAASADNVGDEFTDVLPGQLTLVNATASAGTAVANIGTRTVTWNGSVAAGGSVTITINATINNTLGTVSNQGSVSYDADGNGSNETVLQTDDPGAAGNANATTFAIGGTLQSIPVLGDLSKLLMALCVLAVGLVFWGFRARQA